MKTLGRRCNPRRDTELEIKLYRFVDTLRTFCKMKLHIYAKYIYIYIYSRHNRHNIYIYMYILLESFSKNLHNSSHWSYSATCNQKLSFHLVISRNITSLSRVDTTTRKTRREHEKRKKIRDTYFKCLILERSHSSIHSKLVIDSY